MLDPAAGTVGVACQRQQLARSDQRQNTVDGRLQTVDCPAVARAGRALQTRVVTGPNFGASKSG